MGMAQACSTWHVRQPFRALKVTDNSRETYLVVLYVFVWDIVCLGLLEGVDSYAIV